MKKYSTEYLKVEMEILDKIANGDLSVRDGANTLMELQDMSLNLTSVDKTTTNRFISPGNGDGRLVAIDYISTIASSDRVMFEIQIALKNGNTETYRYGDKADRDTNYERLIQVLC